MNIGRHRTANRCSSSPQINHQKSAHSTATSASLKSWHWLIEQSYVFILFFAILLTLWAVQYAVNIPMGQQDIGEREWKLRIVTELDSALNKWVDSLPEHREFPTSRLSRHPNFWVHATSTLGSRPRRHALPRAVCRTIRILLHATNCGAPAVHHRRL